MNRLILTFVCLLGILSLQAQTRNKQYEEYIKKYREILSDKKIYMVYWAEIKFSRNMLKILQEIDDTKK